MNATEWIAQRRELLWTATEGPWAPWLDQDGAKHMNGLLMVGNADAVIPDGEVYIEGVDVNPVAHTYTPEDRAFIADARTSLPRALDALEAVLDLARQWEGSPDLLPASLRPYTRSERLRVAIETALRAES